jgi:hypothetical protein
MTCMLHTHDYACFIKFHVMKKHARVQVMLHVPLTLLTDRGEWPASRLVRFTSEESGPQKFCRFRGERQICTRAVNRTPTFQLTANHHND